MYFTSESVTDGHPDKICDQIADAILDAALTQDKESKMAVEATIKDDFVLIYGEANTKAVLDYEALAKAVIADIGYTEPFTVLVKVAQQSSQINAAVGDFQGAGDQGIMFGYATDETPSYMPLTIDLAHKLAKRLSDAKQTVDWLLPDGKTQVTVKYDEDLNPLYVSSILVSASHKESVSQETLKAFIINEIILPTIPETLIHEDTTFIINPSGAFSIAGPFSDSGTTGRKIVVDTYGGWGRIGGGCFSSKDPSKVDRSAAYFARHVAKSVVASGLAKRCEIQLSYAIGLAQPLSIFIETFGTGTVSNAEILKRVEATFDFSVAAMIEALDLKRPIYRNTATFGHFGRSEFPWEAIKTLN